MEELQNFINLYDFNFEILVTFTLIYNKKKKLLNHLRSNNFIISYNCQKKVN